LREDKRRALLFGRFQPFHKGHLGVVKWTLQRYDEIVIMVGMASESHTFRNPFTAGERIWMIREALREEGIPLDRVITSCLPTMEVHVGCAIYVVKMVPPVQAIVTRNPVLAQVFKDAGLVVEEPPSYNREKYRGEYIRTLISRSDPKWMELVPPAVARIIMGIGGDKRIQAISRRD
jgi:nicotinamide-nucleotide adenylyltransferase